MNIASPGDTTVENNKLRARSERSLRNIPRIAKMNTESMATHCDMSIAMRIASSIRNTRSRTTENPKNLPNMIIHRRMGFERMRYIVRPSISRAMSPPARNSITARPESSIKESQKSIITRLFSPRARESSPRDKIISTMERKIISEKNRLRTISRNVLSAILNIL